VKLLSSSMKLRNRNLADMPNRKMIGVARIVQLSHQQDFLAVLQGLDQAVEGRRSTLSLYREIDKSCGRRIVSHRSREKGIERTGC
jgi:hypothetical protein